MFFSERIRECYGCIRSETAPLHCAEVQLRSMKKSEKIGRRMGEEIIPTETAFI